MINLPLKSRKTRIYILMVLAVASLLSGTILLRGQSPTETYLPVGGVSDITSIKAYSCIIENGKPAFVEQGTIEKREETKLVLRTVLPVNIIEMLLKRTVLDSKPSFLSLQISVTGSQEFTYVLSLNVFNTTEVKEKLNITRSISATELIELAKENSISPIKISETKLDSKSGLVTLANIQIQQAKKPQYEGPEWIEFIEIRTHNLGENFIERVEIRNLAFVYEKEGREPSQMISLGADFYVLGAYFLIILFIFPLLFLKKQSKYSLGCILLLGFLLRVSIAPFTSHNFDILGCKRAVRMYYEEGVLSLFTSWTSPPVWFFVLLVFHAPYIALRKIGLPDFRVYYQPILALEVLFIKLPLILSDVMSAYLIYKICRKMEISESRSKLVLAVFMFNPLNIFFPAIWGMFDSLAVFFMLLGFYYVVEGKFYVAALIWGLGVKWYSLAFIPFLAVAWYLKENQRGKMRRIVGGLLVLAIGFGTFAALMVTPHILHGNTAYLKQVLEFRLKTGGGGEDRASLTTFFGPVVWRIFEHIGLIHAVPNFFLYLFTPLYIVLLAIFYIHIKKCSEAEKFFSVLNSTFIGVLLAFYLTYPQLTPQCILWIVPLLLFAFVIREVNSFPLIATSLFIIPYMDLTYFIVGFSVPFAPLSVKAISVPLECTVAVVLLPFATVFLLKRICRKCYIEAKKRSETLISRHVSKRKMVIAYFLVNAFVFVQILIAYTFNIAALSGFIATLLIATVTLQHVIFLAMDSNTK